jgi:hypothetical protein
MKKETLAFWLLVFSLTLFLFYPTLKYYFFQDDFYLFRISQITNLTQFFKLFIPPKDVTFYRPVSDLIVYFLGYKIFGQKAVYYHWFGLMIHGFNTILIYFLIKKISKLKPLAYLCSFFYALSANHYMALSWVAAYHYLIGTSFALLSFLCFLKGVEEKKHQQLLFSLLLGLVAILSEQIIIVLPWLILLYLFLFIKKPKKTLLNNYWYFLGFVALSLFYPIFRFFAVRIPFEASYTVSFDLQSLRTLFWHLLWALNVPEEFKYQLISFFRINPKFINDFYEVNKKVWNLLWANLLLVYATPFVLLLIKQLKKKTKMWFPGKISLFGLIWFLIALLPVMFFPLHQYPYFLTLASIGWFMFFLSPLAWLIKNYLSKSRTLYLYIFLIGGIWFYSSLVNFRFTQSIHWIKDRQAISQSYLGKIREQFPKPEPGTTIVIRKKDEIIINSLMESEASFFLYGNTNARLVYSDFEVPKECLGLKVATKQYQDCLRKNKIFFLTL